METDRDRLEKLERQVKHYRNLNAVLALIVIVFTSITITESFNPDVSKAKNVDEIADIIKCRQLWVVSDTGTPHIIGSAKDGNGFLTVLSEDRGSVVLSVDMWGHGFLEVFTKAGERVARCGATFEGNGEVEIFSESDKPMVSMGVAGRGKKRGYLEIFSQGSKAAVGVQVGMHGGFLGVSNRFGESIVQLYADKYGNGTVNTYNREEVERTLLFTPKAQ